MYTYPAIISQSPMRRPEWRRVRVLELLAAPHPKLTTWDDGSIREYYRFLRLLANAAANEEALSDTQSSFPVILSAHFIYCGDVETRQLLEARLLTRGKQKLFGFVDSAPWCPIDVGEARNGRFSD